MCVPLAAVGTALPIVGGAANFLQQSASAADQRDLNKEISQRNISLANQTAVSQYGQIAEHTQQNDVSAGEAAQKVQEDALMARGRVSAAAAEAGVSGGSVDALLNDFSRQEGNRLSAISISQQYERQQAEAERTGVRIGLDSRQISATQPFIPGPSLFGASLSTFSSAFSTGLQIDSAVKQAGGKALYY